MAETSVINVNGADYDIKDKVARQNANRALDAIADIPENIDKAITKVSADAPLVATALDPTEEDTEVKLSLEMDTTPTEGSTKPVTSAGILAAIKSALKMNLILDTNYTTQNANTWEAISETFTLTKTSDVKVLIGFTSSRPIGLAVTPQATTNPNGAGSAVCLGNNASTVASLSILSLGPGTYKIWNMRQSTGSGTSDRYRVYARSIE